METMEIEVVVTRYNITALIGWAGIMVGLIGAVAQYFNPSSPEIYFLAAGLIFGGVVVTCAGSWRTVKRYKVPIGYGDRPNQEP